MIANLVTGSLENQDGVVSRTKQGEAEVLEFVELFGKELTKMEASPEGEDRSEELEMQSQVESVQAWNQLAVFFQPQVSQQAVVHEQGKSTVDSLLTSTEIAPIEPSELELPSLEVLEETVSELKEQVIEPNSVELTLNQAEEVEAQVNELFIREEQPGKEPSSEVQTATLPEPLVSEFSKVQDAPTLQRTVASGKAIFQQMKAAVSAQQKVSVDPKAAMQRVPTQTELVSQEGPPARVSGLEQELSESLAFDSELAQKQPQAEFPKSSGNYTATPGLEVSHQQVTVREPGLKIDQPEPMPAKVADASVAENDVELDTPINQQDEQKLERMATVREQHSFSRSKERKAEEPLKPDIPAVATDSRVPEPQLDIKEEAVPLRKVLNLADGENLVPKLVQSMESLVTEERSEVRIQLKPDHLGELNIKLSLERGIMVAEFTVQHESVREIIASQLPQLQTALQQQGTQVNDVQINVGLGNKQQGQQERPNSRQAYRNTQGRMAKTSASSANQSYLGRSLWNQVDVKV